MLTHFSAPCLAALIVAALFCWTGAMAQSQPSSQTHQEENVSKPSDQDAGSKPGPTNEQQQQTETRQPDQQNVAKNRNQGRSNPNIFRRIIGFVEAHDKLFNVISTGIIAAFTVVLAIATMLLRTSTDQLRDFAEEQSKDMKASIDAGRTSADAAKKAADIAEQAMRITQRAYVSITPSLTDFADGSRPTVFIRVQNVGTTPAYDATATTFLAVAPFPLPVDFAFPGELVALPTKSVIPNGQAIRAYVTRADPLFADEFNAIVKGTEKRLYVWGTVNYRDAFGVKHYANYCFQYDGRGATSNAPDYCDRHNDSD